MLPRNSRVVALEIAGKALEVCGERGRSSVSGTLRGRELTFSVDSSERCWSVLVATWQLPLAIDVTARHLYPELDADLVSAGDPSFDDRLQMDAAPADLARAALDETLRRRLVVLGAERLALIGDVVRLDKDYAWYFAEEADIREAIDLALTFAERADAVCRDADAAGLEAVRRGAPYRGVPDSATAAAERDQTLAEVTAVVERYGRRRRISPSRRKYSEPVSPIVIVLAVLIAVLAILSKIYAAQ